MATEPACGADETLTGSLSIAFDLLSLAKLILDLNSFNSAECPKNFHLLMKLSENMFCFQSTS